jgi:N-acetyl sugar amidotransferase
VGISWDVVELSRLMILNLGINASRARSGGAFAHLVGVLEIASPADFGFNEVHVWSHSKLLDALPVRPWLIKHGPPELDLSLWRQLWWERFSLANELRKANCSILLNMDAGSVSRFRPAVTMSRDMLSYEPGEIARYGICKASLRLMVLRYVQNHALRSADGAIFLTRYAARVIQGFCGSLSNIAYIPHGVGDAFRLNKSEDSWPTGGERPIRCLYVSNALPYKHQWNVVKAVEQLRQRGYDLQLELVGGGDGSARRRLNKQITESDPGRVFVSQHEFVPQESLPAFLAKADLFIFASSCENMPNTLVEAMAAGLPIACSNRGPMPEVLEDGGTYFDPENPDSIASAIEDLILDPSKRTQYAFRATELSRQYSWARCASETLAFLRQNVKTGPNVSRRRINENSYERPYQICTKLVMDTSDSKVHFDSDGVCNYYHDFQENVKPFWRNDSAGEMELERRADEIRQLGKGRDFDCILGLSGGADSSYMLHVMVKKYGLRPLVFHVDGGWNSDIAVHNINGLIEGLGLDLFTEVINWEEMRDFQLAMFKSGVPHLDIPQDMAFIGVLYKFAQKHKIKFILNGGNISTECVPRPLDIIYWGTDMAQIRDIISRFGTNEMRTYPFSSIYFHKIYLRFTKGIRVFKPLNFMPYVKSEAMHELEKEYGWKPYPQKHFESRFTRFFEGYWLPTRFGFDMRRVDFSSLILTGQMTRDEALERLKKLPYDPDSIQHDFDYIATKLGITAEELRGYQEMPKKYYWDYRNQQHLFRLGELVLTKTVGARRGGAF